MLGLAVLEVGEQLNESQSGEVSKEFTWTVLPSQVPCACFPDTAGETQGSRSARLLHSPAPAHSFDPILTPTLALAGADFPFYLSPSTAGSVGANRGDSQFTARGLHVTEVRFYLCTCMMTMPDLQ